MYINTNEEGRNWCIRPRADLRLVDMSPQRLGWGRIVTDRMRIQSLKNVRIEGTTEICSTTVGYSKIHERGVVWCVGVNGGGQVEGDYCTRESESAI